ncbi:hypothetical protein [Paractinoplanes lichenicola]|uniref:DUF4328 domain-containing protein n=1 Tax=Paractinoplanes lichenicola TaxID=2802976 RepID=A0ABS1VI71_9ACTN|nr:hypothetical protein [Actinoplanes lichenicola]MBL7254407.1 hypothetical protein [Actinoplanes lichenicola]
MCERCGARLDHAGQGHTCRTAYPEPGGLPVGWQILTGVVALLALMLGLTTVAHTITRFQAVQSGAAAFAGVSVLISLIWSALAIVVFVAHMFWSRGTRRLADRFGDESGWYVRPRNVVALYVALFFLGAFALCAAGGRLGLAVILGGAIEFLVIAFLTLAVLAGWFRLHRLAADSATQTYGAAAVPIPPSRRPVEWPAADLPEAGPPAAGDPIVEQPRGLGPHRAPLNAVASDADWNPHHWDPEEQPPGNH